jgi:hypothetical protein
MSGAKQIIGGSQQVCPHAVVPGPHCRHWPSTHVWPKGQQAVPQRTSLTSHAEMHLSSTQSSPLSQHVPPQISPYLHPQWPWSQTNGGSQQLSPQPFAPVGHGAQPCGVQCSPSAQQVSMQNVELGHLHTPRVPSNTWQTMLSSQHVSPHWVVPCGHGVHTAEDDDFVVSQ